MKIQSNNENFTFNADGASSQIEFEVNGVNIASIGATGWQLTDTAVNQTGTAISMLDGGYFYKTITGITTLTFTNPPATGQVASFTLELINGGAFAVTWPTSVKWQAGTAPTLTAAGTDMIVFTTRDAGTTWFGFVSGLGLV